MARLKIGELLVKRGVIPEDKLEAVLAACRNGEKFGRAAIRLGLVDEAQVADVLAVQLGVLRFDPMSYPPDLALAEHVPTDLAFKYKTAPVARDRKLLYVGVLDPLDLAMQDSLSRATGFDVEPVLCTESELNETALNLYGKTFSESAQTVDLQDLCLEGDEDDEDSGELLSVDSLQSMAEDAPVVKAVNAILLQSWSKKASDVHLSRNADGVLLRIRIDGSLKTAPPPPNKLFTAIVSRIKLLSNLDISITRAPQDGRFSFTVKDKEIAVRTSTIPTIHGEKIVLRLHEQSSRGMGLGDLGLAEVDVARIRAALAKPHGMALATGPTGSGKTTLLYAVLRELSQPEVNCITLEDPVESRIDDVTQIQLNTKAGMTFASGLKSILRQDPDVILVGEIRDPETAAISVKAAMTGHKVLSTLHTNTACQAVGRLADMAVDPFLIASTLTAIAGQRLVKRLCVECREAYPASTDVALRLVGQTVPLTLFKGRGCRLCENSGYRGRLGVYSILAVDDAVREHIIRGASAMDIEREAIRSGSMRSLKTDAADKVLWGDTSFEQFIRSAY